MGAAENLDVHSQCTEAENGHDLSQHGDFFHDDIAVVVAGGDSTVGIDAYRASLESLFQGMSDFKVVLEDQFATDDRVVCRWRATARTTVSSTAFPPPGGCSTTRASASGSSTTARRAAGGSTPTT